MGRRSLSLEMERAVDIIREGIWWGSVASTSQLQRRPISVPEAVRFSENAYPPSRVKATPSALGPR